MGHAVLVFGAAGAGKTTFCRRMKAHAPCNIRLVNLDPANEAAGDYDVDLCDHITVSDVMSSMDLGPNGGLFHAMREMRDNIEEIGLQELEDEFIFIDFPGQLELFLHSDIIHDVIKSITRYSRAVLVYLTDATNFTASDKWMYTMLCGDISVARFCLPVLSVLTKADLVSEAELEGILQYEYIGGVEDIENVGDIGEGVSGDLTGDSSDSPVDLGEGAHLGGHANNHAEDHRRSRPPTDEYARLSRAFKQMLEGTAELSCDFVPLNWNDPEDADTVLMHLNRILQRDEDAEPA